MESSEETSAVNCFFGQSPTGFRAARDTYVQRLSRVGQPPIPPLFQPEWKWIYIHTKGINNDTTLRATGQQERRISADYHRRTARRPTAHSLYRTRSDSGVAGSGVSANFKGKGEVRL